MKGEAQRPIGALLEKYEELSALRQERANDEGAAAPAARLRALAARFPGALAQLDRLRPETLQARLAELRAACGRNDRQSEEPTPEWVRVELAMHAALRGILSAKAFLAGRREIQEELVASYRAAHASMPEALAFADRLAHVASPPEGRLLEVALIHVAIQLELPADAVREHWTAR